MSRRSAISHRASQQRAASRMTPGTRMWSEQPYTNPAGRAVVAEPEFKQNVMESLFINRGSRLSYTATTEPAGGWRTYTGGLTPADYAYGNKVLPTDTLLAISITRSLDESFDPEYATLLWSGQWNTDRVTVWTLTGLPVGGTREHYENLMRYFWTVGPKVGAYWQAAHKWTFFRNLPAGVWTVSDVRTSEDLSCVLSRPTSGLFNMQVICGLLGNSGGAGPWWSPAPSGWAGLDFGDFNDMAERLSSSTILQIPESTGVAAGDWVNSANPHFLPNAYRNDGTYTHSALSGIFGPKRNVTFNLSWDLA